MTAAGDRASADERAWTERPERSNLVLLRLMVWISLHLGRAVGRLVLHGIAGYFFVFAPGARRASADYLRRVLGRRPALAERYRHLFDFASTIHDRIYLLNDRFDLFDIDIVGEDAVRAALSGGRGALLIGSHLGSFEVLGAVGRRYAEHPVSMLVFEGNARMINATLAAINPAATRDIVPLGRLDSLLVAKDKVDAGHLVGILADRSFGDDAGRDCAFLGAPAPFPLGPWRIAAMLRCPVLFMTGLYLGGNRYRVHFELLADFSQLERSGRDTAIAAAQRAFVGRLEDHCRAAPFNWFNFFDFWQGR